MLKLINKYKHIILLVVLGVCSQIVVSQITPPPGAPPPPPGLPIDTAIFVLAATAVGYGIKKIRK